MCDTICRAIRIQRKGSGELMHIVVMIRREMCCEYGRFIEHRIGRKSRIALSLAHVRPDTTQLLQSNPISQD